MDEKEIIKQLKELRAIKPNKDWVLLNKGKLLKQGSAEKKERTGWIFVPLGRPALVLSTLALVAVVLVGGLFYFSARKTPVVVYENIEGLLNKIISQGQNKEQIVSSLSELQTKLEDIKSSLDGLKNAKDQGQALAVTEVVKATAKRGEEVAITIKNTNRKLSEQVLASFIDLGKKGDSLQKEIFEELLRDLKQRSLSQEDRERLEKVEQYYAEGKMDEAMILITKIGN